MVLLIISILIIYIPLFWILPIYNKDIFEKWFIAVIKSHIYFLLTIICIIAFLIIMRYIGIIKA